MKQKSIHLKMEKSTFRLLDGVERSAPLGGKGGRSEKDKGRKY
jgi:hypothetical protein